MKFETASAAPVAAAAPAQTAAPVAATTSAIKDVNVPDIGGDEVNVTEIMVAVGDTVSEDQSLITVEVIKLRWKCLHHLPVLLKKF